MANTSEESPEVIPPARVVTPADRVKASKLRGKARVGAPMSPEEAAWLNDYENRPPARGASHSRKVSYSEEESAAVGTGAAAEVAAAAAYAREEGKREDNLARIGIEALVKANEFLLGWAREARKENSDLKQVHMAMLSTVREQYLGRTNAEIELMKAEAENEEGGDDISKMVKDILPALLPKLLEAQGKKPPAKSSKK